MNKLEDLLLSAYSQYPLSQAQDYYKLVYQACFGPRHLLHSTKMMKQFFMQEWEDLLLSPNKIHPCTNFIEDITLFHPLARIHFGAAMQKKVPPDEVFNAFLITISKFQPVSTLTFLDVLSQSQQLLTETPFSLQKDSIESVWQSGIIDPPNSLHHSALFNEMYHPHYRIAIPSLLAEEFGTGDCPLYQK